MPLREVLRIALASLGVNKLRSGLAMLGISIGVFSVIGVMTAVTALKGSIENSISSLGSNTFKIDKFPGFSITGNNRWKYINRRNISYDDCRRFIQLMNSTTELTCLTLSNKSMQAVYGGQKTNPNQMLYGTNQYFAGTNQYDITYGRNLTAEDVDLARNVAVIGKTIETTLFPNESPIGKTIRIGGKTFSVVGVFAGKSAAFGGSQDDMAIVPITKFLEYYGSKGRTVQIAVQAASQDAFGDTMDEAIGIMRKVRELRPEQPNDFELYSNDSLVSAFDKIADMVAIGAFVISAIALLAAGIGIMNIMLVSVTERTKEIGIRKSIGAKKANILWQFLIEAVTISVLGGIAGIVLGVLGGNGFALWFSFDLVFPWGWAIAGVAVCTTIGVGFGFYPAYRAAALDPIDALRFE